MVTAFDREKQRIQQEYQKHQRQLETQRREAEATITGAAREQLSELERRQQELLGELRTEEQRRKRLVAIGQRLPRVPIEQEKKRIEAEAKKAEADIEKAKKEAAAELKKAVEEPQQELEEWREKSLAELQKAEAEFQAENIELKTGEWVSRADFQKLSKEQQDKLKSMGVEKFNQVMAREVSEAEQEQTQALKEFEAQHVKLDTGEWVPKDIFDNLDPQSQVLLRQKGYDAFMKEFEKNHVKLDTGEWVARKDFEALDPKWQMVLKKEGSEGLDSKWRDEYIEARPGEWFAKTDWDRLTPAQQNEVKATGSYSTAIGAYSYDLDEIEKRFLAYPESQQRAMISSQVKYRLPWEVKKDVKENLASLTEKQRERVLVYFATVVEPTQTTEQLKTLMKQQLKAWGGFYISLVPVAGTIYHWDNMSPTWRAISIAMDALIVVSWARAGIQALRAAKITPIKTGAAQLAKAESALTKQMATKLSKAYGKTIGTAYTTMMKAQNAYLKELASVEELIRKGKAVSVAKKVNLLKLETMLRGSGDDFARMMRPQAGFDSKEIAKLLDGFGDDLVRNTKAAVEGLKPTNIQALQAAADKAQVALTTAQTKHPTDPSKWVDLLYDHAMKQAKLERVKIGAIERIWEQLLVARRAGKTTEVAKLEKQLMDAIRASTLAQAPVGDIDAIYRQLDAARKAGKTAEVTRLEKQLIDALRIDAIYKQAVAAREAGKTAEVARLEKQLREAIRAMDIEWVEGGAISRGRAGTLVADPWAPTRAATLPKIASPGVQLAPLIAIAPVKLVGIEPDIVVSPREVPAVSPTVLPEIAPMVVSIVKATPEVAGVTKVEVEAISEAAVKAATQAAIEGLTEAEIKAATQTAAQTQVKAATKTQVKTIVKTATKLGLRWRLLAEDKKEKFKPKKERPTYPAGTIAWKQGMYWKIIPPPYDLKKPIHSIEAPKGVTRLEGTPQQTLTFIKGKLPFSDVSFDLGVVDGFIDVKKRTINFTGGGLETDVGKRKPEPTRGISLEKVLPRKTVPRKAKKRIPTNKALRRKIDKVVTA